ncbi:MAG TPA: helix-turn-helix domain-containing protein [Polyangiaceae bacterium]|nr:helix-turn-helix domain-containing protein [Polyangiaceae bacterium]
MADGERRALLQRFLPDRRERAFVWKYDQAVGGRRPRHFHEEPEVNLVTCGAATFGVGDRIVEVKAGELLAFPAGVDHALLAASPDLYLYAVGLDPTFSTGVLTDRHDTIEPWHARLPPKELRAVVDRAAELVDRSGAERLGAELWERVHWLARRSTEAERPGAHVLTRRTLKLVATQPDCGLEALASELRTHPSEVSRHFHRDVGVTLVRYRTRLRLLRLVHLVDDGQDVMTAAIEAGFGSYSQCHRSFHAELGCAPTSFFRSEARERMQLLYAG